MHFEHHYKIDLDTKNQFVYIEDLREIGSGEYNTDHPWIYFFSSNREVSTQPFFDNRGNLVLFPGSSQQTTYEIIGDNLIFYHDYLKTIFYFISGYQEWETSLMDQFGRFEYRASLQSRYNLPPLPFTNGIMDLIAEGLSKFCQGRSFSIEKRPIFERGIFLLSHDIDHIQQYRLSYFKYKIKEILGLVKNKKHTRSQLFNFFQQGIAHRISGKQDPAWSFDFIHNANLKYGIKSTFFFLNKDGQRDASFDIHSQSVRTIINKIAEWDDEIGVHGTMASSKDLKAAAKIYKDVQNVSAQQIQGIRQHWLMYRFPETTRIHQSLRYKYDATLGFNDRAGFRNGYCFPFKLWDFDHQKPFEVWQIPLCVMDVTLLSYMNLSLDECIEEVGKWVKEVNKYSGVFSLLWHNTSLNEVEEPGIRSIYLKIIELCTSNFDGMTHAKMTEYMENQKL